VSALACKRCGSFLKDEALAVRGIAVCDECLDRFLAPPSRSYATCSLALAALFVALLAGGALAVVTKDPGVAILAGYYGGMGGLFAGALAGLFLDARKARRERRQRDCDGVAWVAALDMKNRVETGWAIPGERSLLFASRAGRRVFERAAMAVPNEQGKDQLKIDIETPEGRARLVLIGKGAREAFESLMY
jgi:hypothetical protein